MSRAPPFVPSPICAVQQGRPLGSNWQSLLYLQVFACADWNNSTSALMPVCYVVGRWFVEVMINLLLKLGVLDARLAIHLDQPHVCTAFAKASCASFLEVATGLLWVYLVLMNYGNYSKQACGNL